FSSGMAATETVLKLLKPGDEVIAGDDLYGGTYRIFTKVFEGYGIKFKFVSFHDVEQLKNEISDRTRLVWIETPTTPTMRIIDIAAVAAVTNAAGAMLAVHNTFASPYWQNPM